MSQNYEQISFLDKHIGRGLSFFQACVIDSPKYEPNRCNIHIINIPLNRVSSICCQLNPTPLLFEAFIDEDAWPFDFHIQDYIGDYR
jgi:hypothetical protein